MAYSMAVAPLVSLAKFRNALNICQTPAPRLLSVVGMWILAVATYQSGKVIGAIRDN